MKGWLVRSLAGGRTVRQPQVFRRMPPRTGALWTLMEDATVSRPTILVVDDEPLLRELTARMLSEASYNVVQAEDGIAALALLSTCLTAIQLVITDVRMPLMDGERLAAAVNDHNVRIPVLFMSGYSSGGPLGRPFLAKPFSPEQLLESVRELLSRDG